MLTSRIGPLQHGPASARRPLRSHPERVASVPLDPDVSKPTVVYRVALVTGSRRGDELSEYGPGGAVNLGVVGQGAVFMQRVPSLGESGERFQRGSVDQVHPNKM